MEFSKPKLYLDPSVFIYYFEDDEEELPKRDVTRRFFDIEVASQQYEVVSSEIVLRVLENGWGQIPGADLTQFAKSLPITYLPVNDAIEAMTRQVEQEGLRAVWEQEIAQHLAFALVFQVKYLVSWNHKRMIKPKPKKILKTMAQKEKLREIRIITPEAVVISGDEV